MHRIGCLWVWEEKGGAMGATGEEECVQVAGACRCVYAQVCTCVHRLRVRAGACTHKCVHVCTGCGCVQVSVGTGVYTCAGQMCAGACTCDAQEELLVSAPAVLAGVLPMGSVVPPFVKLK